MSKPRTFLSWLAGHFERFVKLRRASGMVYLSQRKLLLAFDRYVAKQAPQPPLCRSQCPGRTDTRDAQVHKCS